MHTTAEQHRAGADRESTQQHLNGLLRIPWKRGGFAWVEPDEHDTCKREHDESGIDQIQDTYASSQIGMFCQVGANKAHSSQQRGEEATVLEPLKRCQLSNQH
mmetsp:Transcript_49262/g.101655  ORF Transcript_49262/g.101655 Transcript_49262/m.101655 type:complete len:103 (+) Transcript_49262:825-1133(+)